MSEWIEWMGGERPVGPFERIEVEFESGGTHIGSGGLFDWRRKFDNGAGIVRYRLLDIPPSDEAKIGIHKPIDEYTKTLRDEFAMSVDTSRIEFPDMQSLADFVGVDEPDGKDFVSCLGLAATANAKIRYMFADAMLAARKEK
ncbi:MAG TPA: hypothetical protein DCY10_05295 [Clostridiales bacterium]|nr:hypothetical protein [Clostridiales bacterium]